MRIHYYRKSDGRIIRVLDIPVAYISEANEGEEFYLNCPLGATHIIDNEPITIIPEPAPPTEAEILAAIISAVQAKLDTVARSKNYDGILSLCSYATSTDATFAAEGQAGVNWRDACWRYCYTVMGEVQAKTRAIPTPAEMVSELPEIVW